VLVLHLIHFSAVLFLAPSEAPKNLKGGVVTRTSIAISWVAPSSESFNGHLMGYKVSNLCVNVERQRNVLKA